MAVLLITYDLNSPGQNHSELLAKIKEYSWVKLSESSYAIETNLSVQLVFDNLKPLIDSNDNLFIINLKKPWSSFGPKEVNNWLENNLTNS